MVYATKEKRDYRPHNRRYKCKKIKIGIGCVITSYPLFCGLNTYLRIQNSLYDKIYI